MEKTYKEVVKELNELRNKNEIIFRCAISHLMDWGIRNITEKAVEKTCKTIMAQDDTHSIMTNEFQCEIVRTAYKLAQYDHIKLLVYIGKNVKFDVR